MSYDLDGLLCLIACDFNILYYSICELKRAFFAMIHIQDISITLSY